MKTVYERPKLFKEAHFHYCPGCGHGIINRLLMEVIEEMGMADKAICVAPAGCGMLLYNYFEIDVIESAHGRGAAVATGIKRVRPDLMVFTYQGDGDLASIGMSEIIHAANRGEKFTTIFINNAVYGMTGGQMAPTTLMGQRTATSPDGRTNFTGMPMKMAELMAGLDGPVFVERVALFNPKQRNRAKKAIHKALQIQVEGRGFAFVEVLAECPTHLKKTPEETEKWVEEKMLPVFPLGVKKDETREPWWHIPPPTFEKDRVLREIGAGEEKAPRFCTAVPAHVAPHDISLKLAGSGGDGAQTAAMLIVHAGINEGFDATHIPAYGPESRGGTSYADVHVADGEVLSPASPRPNVLIAFNMPSLVKFGPDVLPGGTIIYDSSVITDYTPVRAGVKVVGVPMSEIAKDLGKVMVKNIVALGALQAATGIFPKETFLTAVRRALKDKCAMIPMNEQAFEWGVKAASEVLVP